MLVKVVIYVCPSHQIVISTSAEAASVLLTVVFLALT